MIETDNLDVLVVYSAPTAISASVKDSISKHPFLLNSRQSNYNLSYAYFLKSCKRLGLSAGLAVSSDIIGPGLCEYYWKRVKDSWVKIKRRGQSFQVFDKLSPKGLIRTTERALLFSDEKVTPFNDSNLYDMFFDKLLSFRKLTRYSIPTVGIKSSGLSDIRRSIGKLKALIATHGRLDDFAKKFVLKDRFGAGGNHVYMIENDFGSSIAKIMSENEGVKFILQPFLKFTHGYSYKDNNTATDIRLIYYQNKFLQGYIRMASDNDFRCNEHQGGKLVYVNKSDLPTSIHKAADRIAKSIDKTGSLYALDFALSDNGQVYFIEGNIGPGIDWNVTKPINELKSKQLINSIVGEFALRVKKDKQPKIAENSYDGNYLGNLGWSHGILSG